MKGAWSIMHNTSCTKLYSNLVYYGANLKPKTLLLFLKWGREYTGNINMLCTALIHQQECTINSKHNCAL